jgi:hypothetical protein
MSHLPDRETFATPEFIANDKHVPPRSTRGRPMADAGSAQAPAAAASPGSSETARSSVRGSMPVAKIAKIA